MTLIIIIAVLLVLTGAVYLIDENVFQDDPIEVPDTDDPEPVCPYCIPCTFCGGVEDDDSCPYHNAFDCGATDEVV